MAVTAAALRELHRIHEQLADLRERLERGPRQVKARQVGLSKLQDELSAEREREQLAKKNNDGKQLDLNSGEQKIIDLGVKLNSASSNKEYQTFLEQIEAAKMTNSVLSDEILEGFDKIEELGQMVQQAEKHVKAGEVELEKTINEVQESADMLKSEIARLEGELTQAESGLPSELMHDYERVVQKRGSEAMAEVDGDVCTACGQKITLNMLNELQMSRLVFCKSCGCLLYLPEV